MEAKEFLKQYQEALTDIRNLEAEAEELETMAMSITVSTDGERVQSSVRPDKMAELAAKVADIEIEIMGLRTAALQTLQEVEEVIHQVKNKEYRQILHMRYIEKSTWEQIAVRLNISYQWVCRLHGRALQDVEKNLNN